LEAIQPSGSKRPFFCIHEFFGGVFLYDLLARCLGTDQPFYGLQAPGLDGEEEPARDIAEMAALYIDAIRTVQSEGPFRLGGLCAGGLVAFEMAQQLRALGEEVSLRALLDASAVSFVSPQSHVRNHCTITDLIRGIMDWFNGMLQLTPEQWCDLIRLQARLGRAMITASIRAMAAGGWLDGADVRIRTISNLFELSGYHLHVAGAFRQVLADYAPKPHVGRAVLFRARMQPLFGTYDPAKGWRSLITGGLDIRVVPGNHLGMLQEPHVRVLALELADALAEQGPAQSSEPANKQKEGL
jgi:thioesterase domain-containing protein